MAFSFIPAIKSLPATQPELTLGLLITGFVLQIGILIALACCPGQFFSHITDSSLICAISGMARKVPHNYILLSLFTVIQGFMLGMVTISYSISEVMLAVGVCAAVTLALTIFAFQTKIDFTVIGGNNLNCP